MHTLIFEGIATSGKSRIADFLIRTLKDKLTIILATEEQTHVPIMEKRSELHINFFEELVSELALKRPDVLMFDRLYITQAYRANTDLSEYASLEAALQFYSPHTILLTVDEESIASRIQAAATHRDHEWRQYLHSKGSTFDEIAQDYIWQQRGLLKLVEQSKLPYTIFNTTNHDYETVCQQVLDLIKYGP